MIAELAPTAAPGALVDHGEAMPGRLTRTGYLLPDGLSFERWEQIGVSLQQMVESVNWWAGDWLLYGRRNYGQDAYQAIRQFVGEVTGHGNSALKQALWIAERFPPAARIEGADWTDHRAVAKLQKIRPEEARALLVKAAAGEMSTDELYEESKYRISQIKGQPVAPACTADVLSPWPTIDDLEPEHRANLELQAGGDPDLIRIALWAWVYADNQAMFRRWVDL